MPEFRTPIIGVCGRKASGKSTLASILEETYGFYELSFASRLKLILADVNPIIGPVAYGGQRRLSAYEGDLDSAKQEPEVRRLLQQLGTSVRDYLGDESWVRPVLGEAQWRLAEGQQIVIPDCRFRNECERIKDLGGMVVQMHRDPIGSSAIDVHVSETEVDSFGDLVDVHIDNVGTVDNLRLSAAEIVERVL